MYIGLQDVGLQTGILRHDIREFNQLRVESIVHINYRSKENYDRPEGLVLIWRGEVVLSQAESARCSNETRGLNRHVDGGADCLPLLSLLSLLSLLQSIVGRAN
jgi:hypothetical protein